MEKVWLKSYPAYVPPQIDTRAMRTLKELLEKSCAAYAAKVAFVQMERTLTFAQLDALTRDFAAWLQAAGFGKGDRIAIMLPNTLQYPIAMFGALRAGLTVVNTNPLYTAPELEHQLSDSGAAIVLVLENFAHVLQQVLPRTQVKRVLVTGVGDLLGFPRSTVVNFVVRYVRRSVPAWHIEGAEPFTRALDEGARLPFAPVEVGPDDLAFLQYTGGTTGVAKGAMLSHGNVAANVLQNQAWLEGTFQDVGCVVLTAIPLYHIFALTANCMLFVRLGWRNLLITNPRDLPGLVATLKRHPCNFITGVNTLYNACLLYTSPSPRD